MKRGNQENGDSIIGLLSERKPVNGQMMEFVSKNIWLSGKDYAPSTVEL